MKARWRAIGLSPSDLAEVLGVVSEQRARPNESASEISVDRLLQIATALGVANGRGGVAAQGPGAGKAMPAEMLLELRLLRLFRELRDPDTRRMLVQLAEQIVKRQAPPPAAG
ncbi:hypothetical protein [Bradyrhizobium lablabi]|uniref:hypothetical protein n=1 Tax=Bradyrhizobium lablabi TaxID=722472 RepID=UPI001BAA137D|nr:hypothetical protein [Bradyrhizobium lablabi]MBR0696913.1 hypothetical protein [Bradyrhizobium lablabi]